MSKGIVRLIDIDNGTLVKISSFEGGPRYVTRLNRFGLYPGDLARVVRHAPFGGPVLLEVRGMEIALGKNIAARILVEVTACASR